MGCRSLPRFTKRLNHGTGKMQCLTAIREAARGRRYRAVSKIPGLDASHRVLFAARKMQKQPLKYTLMAHGKLRKNTKPQIVL